MIRLLRCVLSFLARLAGRGTDDALDRRVREIKARRELRELRRMLREGETPSS